MENDNTVLLNPPLFALDKDAPLRYAGRWAASSSGKGGRQGETSQEAETGQRPSLCWVLALSRKRSPPNLPPGEVPSEGWRQSGHSLV